MKEAGGAGECVGMPYSMMCRASTSETSSLSGSGIFFFSSTGRVGGCAGCGCSSSSSYQEKRLHQLKTPHRDRPRDPQGEHTFRSKRSFDNSHTFFLSRNVSCLLFASLLIARRIIFSFPSRVQTLLFKAISGYFVRLFTNNRFFMSPAPIIQCILHIYSLSDLFKLIFTVISLSFSI